MGWVAASGATASVLAASATVQEAPAASTAQTVPSINAPRVQAQLEPQDMHDMYADYDGDEASDHGFQSSFMGWDSPSRYLLPDGYGDEFSAFYTPCSC